jgi:hypothetical protein
VVAVGEANNIGLLLLIIAGLGSLIVKVLIPSIVSLSSLRGRPKTDPPPAGGSPHSGRGNGSAMALNDWAACRSDIATLTTRVETFQEEQRRCNDAQVVFFREEMLPVLRSTRDYLGELRRAEDREALAKQVADNLRQTGEGMVAAEDGRRRVVTPR